MKTDREIAEKVNKLQTSARDFALVEIPGYSAWSNKKLDQGVSPALIENLDARSMWLRPEEVAAVSESEFEELLTDLKAACGE